MTAREIYKEAIKRNYKRARVFINQIEIADILIDKEGYRVSCATAYLEDGSEKTLWFNDCEAYINSDLFGKDRKVLFMEDLERDKIFSARELYKRAIRGNYKRARVFVNKIEIADIFIDKEDYMVSYATTYLEDGSVQTVWLHEGEAHINEHLFNRDTKVLFMEEVEEDKILSIKEIYGKAVKGGHKRAEIFNNEIKIAHIYIDKKEYEVSYAILYLKDGSKKTTLLDDCEAHINTWLHKKDTKVLFMEETKEGGNVGYKRNL